MLDMRLMKFIAEPRFDPAVRGMKLQPLPPPSPDFGPSHSESLSEICLDRTVEPGNSAKRCPRGGVA